VVIVVLFFGFLVWLLFQLTNPKPVTEGVSEAAKSIFYDAKWYEILWERWTVVDWLLSLLAAGTAVTAAVKNAFSAHTQTGSPEGDQGSSAKVDRVVMWFAALTVVATTLDAKIHPAQLAERYRQGDLLLQDAIMDYRHSPKGPADEEALLNVWHQAQRILEGAPAVPPKPESNQHANPGIDSKTPGGPGKITNKQPSHE
jgi:hypothetical protein